MAIQNEDKKNQQIAFDFNKCEHQLREINAVVWMNGKQWLVEWGKNEREREEEENTIDNFIYRIIDF